MSTEIEFVPDPSSTISRPGVACDMGIALPVRECGAGGSGGSGAFTPYVVNVAALRLVTTPTTTIWHYVQGNITAGDGLGGIYYFDTTSLAVDDGNSVVKPTAVDAGDPGRWLKFIG